MMISEAFQYPTRLSRLLRRRLSFCPPSAGEGVEAGEYLGLEWGI